MASGTEYSVFYSTMRRAIRRPAGATVEALDSRLDSSRFVAFKRAAQSEGFLVPSSGSGRAQAFSLRTTSAVRGDCLHKLSAWCVIHEPFAQRFPFSLQEKRVETTT